MKNDAEDNADTYLFPSPHAERLAELGCFEWDIRSNKVKWSDGLFRIYGLEPQQFGATLQAFMERVVPEDRDQVQTAIQTAIESCSSFSCVERIFHTSGEIRYLESNGEVLTDENGEPAKLIGVCRDVSDKKKLEMQLGNSQKMEAVARLAAGVAHDFNNLLTVININAEFLLSEPEAGVIQPFAAAILDAGTRASNLTSQLLMFGRKGAANQQVIDLNEHIANSEQLLSSLLGDRITLNSELLDGPLMIEVDPTHLDQVLVNLAVNAFDAMPDGGSFMVRTTVEQITDSSVEASEIRSGEYVVMLVSDTGEGMSKLDCERAFEPFYSDKPAGTGLGLAVVYGVVNECKGLVQLSSEPGVGTTFRLLFPAADSFVESSVAASNLPAKKASGGRILIVDDEALVRNVAHYTLEKNGYEVLSAESGEQALKLLSTVDGKVDLLLSDVVMPGMTGPELVDVVIGKNPGMSVLYISGYNDALVGTIAKQKLLPKPFSIQQLLGRVQDALTG